MSKYDSYKTLKKIFEARPGLVKISKNYKQITSRETFK